jgi:hypothetical protein
LKNKRDECDRHRKIRQKRRSVTLVTPFVSTFFGRREKDCVMPHSAELIETVRRLIERDYPSTQYVYRIERGIPGTGMRPDIMVCDQAGGVFCVVEIGYTLPEKLTAYRDDLKIPDVRWYDKQGRLHVKAVAHYKKAVAHCENGTWRLEIPELDKALATAEQAVRFNVDTWQETVKQWLGDRKDTAVSEVLKDALKIVSQEQTRSAEMRVAGILVNLGFIKYRAGSDGARNNRYRRV